MKMFTLLHYGPRQEKFLCEDCFQLLPSINIRIVKSRILVLSFCVLFIFCSSTTARKIQFDLSETIVGTWIWKAVLDAETGQDMGLDMVTMGMATEVKIEFKKDQTYVESKLRKGNAEYSTTNGEWKIDNDEILNLKGKDKWRPSKILKFSNDFLLLQMNAKMNLLMIRQK
jgi:Domain of unknown function (DUF5004)